jgi:hypothetical protein
VSGAGSAVSKRLRHLYRIAPSEIGFILANRNAARTENQIGRDAPPFGPISEYFLTPPTRRIPPHRRYSTIVGVLGVPHLSLYIKIFHHYSSSYVDEQVAPGSPVGRRAEEHERSDPRDPRADWGSCGPLGSCNTQDPQPLCASAKEDD